MLTQERLKQLLHYDPETGIWTWLVNRTGRGAKKGDHPTHLEGSGYIQFSIDGRNYRSCRLVFLYMTGAWPVNYVDHIDLDKINDRWINLREATHSQNMANCGVSINNRLGIKGVRYQAEHKSKPYRARIMVNRKAVHLGYFETEIAANEAYRVAAERYFGEFARAA